MAQSDIYKHPKLNIGLKMKFVLKCLAWLFWCLLTRHSAFDLSHYISLFECLPAKLPTQIVLMSCKGRETVRHSIGESQICWKTFKRSNIGKSQTTKFQLLMFYFQRCTLLLCRSGSSFLVPWREIWNDMGFANTHENTSTTKRHRETLSETLLTKHY